MSKRFALPILAALLAVLSANIASAAYFGAANYSSCGCNGGVVSDGQPVAADGAAAGSGAASDGCTIMVNRQRVVYEPQQFTGYRNVTETVYEDVQVPTVFSGDNADVFALRFSTLTGAAGYRHFQFVR